MLCSTEGCGQRARYRVVLYMPGSTTPCEARMFCFLGADLFVLESHAAGYRVEIQRGLWREPPGQLLLPFPEKIYPDGPPWSPVPPRPPRAESYTAPPLEEIAFGDVPITETLLRAVVVKRLSQARCAWCPYCAVLFNPDRFHTLAQVAGLHERSTGHRLVPIGLVRR